MEPKRLPLRPYAKSPELDLQSMTEDYLTYGHRIAQYVADTAQLTWDVLDTGAQRALRGRAGHAAGHRPRHVSVRDLVEPGLRLAPARAPASGRRTSTRSGASPRRTPRASAPARSRPSSTTSSASTLREAGGEYGTTTGRARRVGWVDLVALRYAARINWLDHLAITKLDVLTGLGTLNVCTRYRGAEEATLRPLSLPPDRHAPGVRRLRAAARLGRGHHASAARSASCRRPRATTSRTSRSSSACRSR